MRFYEYESRRIVERAGIPVTKYGFCTTVDEARKAAEDIGGPVVIKSQVLTGGRMKAPYRVLVPPVDGNDSAICGD